MLGAKEKPKRFASPEDEITFLRGEVAKRERALLERNQTADAHELAVAGADALREYAEHHPAVLLAPGHQMDPHERRGHAEMVSVARHKTEEIVNLAFTRGIRNALSVLEDQHNPHLVDDVHRALIEALKEGKRVADMKEGMPLWNVLHMTLFSVALPEAQDEDEPTRPLKELVSAMEQFYAGMRSVSRGAAKEHFTIEIAVSDKSDDIVFYVAVPSTHTDLFEKHILSLYPHAILEEQVHDYNIFVENGASVAAVAKLRKHFAYPLKTYDEFDHDPMSVLLNGFSKIEKDGGGASIQIVLRDAGDHHQKVVRGIEKKVGKGVSPEKAIRLSTVSGELFEGVKDVFKSQDSKKKEKEHERVDDKALELFDKKLQTPTLEADIRIAVSARSEGQALRTMREIESALNQFESPRGNGFSWSHPKGKQLDRTLRAFAFREFTESEQMPLTTGELAGIAHFLNAGSDATPQFKQSRAKSAPAPLELPGVGTHIGYSEYRSKRTEVYLTEKDRLRHLYVIGQTGTGKSVFLKKLAIDDILAGNGVCFMDPHGTDILDILAAVPPEREKDVIYFDPSYMDRVIGLNMLEYDVKHPEQKTFVVNELFSIFQKLYGKVPESMGPMFEQYFRNATLLVLEDPESGSTMLDISRVMADPEFRRAKLAKARNPVVIEFWTKIATQAGGDAALENIIPYITSKFDVFTANDYMRPIIGQQESSFDFRELMDQKKILLVNLAKGRLGEINANLIGMIIVGKLLMAALSRVDNIRGDFPPFYLYIDEFQNVTTNSISAILSEARKYKLSLTVAHQFIAQIDEGIRDAVFGNVGSMVSFRVGADDAEALEKQFAPVFSAHDLMNIENYNAYVRILANGTPARPFNIKTYPITAGDDTKIERLIHDSYDRYGMARTKVEMRIAARYRS
ncbi:MAG: hypothetical protein RLZZ234_845 [Candidatus Parcubacteria bacterium]|jgi:hypothetical protein